MPMPTFPLARLGHFRAELHACFTRRADALFELGDALLCAQAVPSLPHLSLEPAHRRGWGSVYAALGRGEVDAERLRDLLAGCLPDADPPVFAVDVTTWPRCDAECSPERGYYYHPSRHSAGQPTRRSARCSGGFPTTGRCRWWCSMPATTRPSSPWTWPSSVWRCWCDSGPTAASMLTRHPRHRARPAGRGATAPSSPSPTRPPGRPRPPP